MANESIPPDLVAGRYHLRGRVGDGNMSTVYEAQDLRRGKRIVAVKMLNSARVRLGMAAEYLHEDLNRFNDAVIVAARSGEPRTIILDYGDDDYHG